VNIINGNMVLNPDFKEFLQLLNVHEVRYLIVGGYAVAFHGHPRYTKDLDVWLWVDPTNSKKIVSALNDFGFDSLGLTEQDFLNPVNVFQLGYPPVRIDLAMSISGVEFDSCFTHKVVTEIDGISVNFIGLEDLKVNKRASGRYIDLDDIENLS
jgi:predicted nucleotidyltransferase